MPSIIGILYSNPSANYLSEFLLGSLEQSSLSGCQLVIEKCEGARKRDTKRYSAWSKAVLTA